MRGSRRAGICGWVALAAVALTGCGAAPPLAESAGDRSEVAERGPARATTPPPARAVTRCDAVRPTAMGGGILSPTLVAALFDDAAAALSEATCDCARAFGIGAGTRVRVATVLVPGRGAIERAEAAMESAESDARDWRGFQGCLDAQARAASLPVHVIGSDVVPDPDPTDERVAMTIRIDVR